jgi:hypothetical protein
MAANNLSGTDVGREVLPPVGGTPKAPSPDKLAQAN